LVNMPAHVFVDSSALRAIDPNTVLGHQLVALAASKKLQLHIPDVVEREVAAGVADDFVDLDRNARFAFAWASRTHELTPESFAQLQETMRKARGLIAAGLSTWLDELSTVRHSVAGMAHAALHAYFAGSPPFRSRRAREDLPDSLIYETICAFAASVPETHVVVSDARLREALDAVKTVCVHESWSSLLRAEPIGLDGEVQFRALWAVAENDIRARIEAALSVGLEYRRVDSIEFPSDDGQATIVGIGSIDDLTFAAEKACLVSTGTALTVPFSCNVIDCLVDLDIFRGDFWSMDQDELSRYSIGRGGSDHYEAVQTYADLAIKGTLLIEFQQRGDGILQGIEDIDVTDIDETVVESSSENSD
jgi:hypothetical protein